MSDEIPVSTQQEAIGCSEPLEIVVDQQFVDSNGVVRDLDNMVRVEPAWAANRMRVMRTDLNLVIENNKRLRGEVAELRGDDSQWPTHSLMTRLADAVDHLLDDHDCDMQGHEGLRIAARQTRSRAARLRGEGS